MFDRASARASLSNISSTTDELMHPQYRLKHVLASAAGNFSREHSIQLHQFLLPGVAQKLATALTNAQLKEQYIPDQYRCHEPRKLPLLAKKLTRWLSSKACATVISAIVQKNVTLKNACWCVYTHRDYTVRHDRNKEPAGYDILIDLTPRWDERACGHHSYVDKKGNELVRIPAGMNTLAIVHRQKGIQKFVKYVNHHAGKERRIVLEARFS